MSGLSCRNNREMLFDLINWLIDSCFSSTQEKATVAILFWTDRLIDKSYQNFDRTACFGG